MDANKTAITHEVTAATALWLDLHGFKPVETEVCVPRKDPEERCWIADIGSIITPTQTELVDLRLLKRYPGWRASAEKREAWQAEAKPLLYRTMTCLVEVKTARGDFRGDDKWMRKRTVDLAYLAMGPGVAAPHEWPEGWGVLELQANGMKCLRPPTPGQTTIEERYQMLMAIAIRRDHFTRYKRWREYDHEDRADRREGTTLHRWSKIIRVIEDLISGKHATVHEALMWSNIYGMHAASEERLIAALQKITDLRNGIKMN